MNFLRNDVIHRKEHFGLIGIRMRDVIIYDPTGDEYMVGSGEGTPDNGGTMVVDPVPRPPRVKASSLKTGHDPADQPRQITAPYSMLIIEGHGLMTLSVATRRQLGFSQSLPDWVDYWSLWSYKGRSLRVMLDEALHAR